MKNLQGPEARKPRSSWRKPLFTLRIWISRYLDYLAETYAENWEARITLEEDPCAGEVGVLPSFK